MKSPWIRRIALSILLSLSLTGCGGGGGGAASSSPSTSAGNTAAALETQNTVATATLNGVVAASGGAGLAGYKVTFDASALGAAAPSATTGSSGAFTIVVPAADITGSDTLTADDMLGSFAASQSVTPVLGQTVSAAITLPNAAPPPPAPL